MLGRRLEWSWIGTPIRMTALMLVLGFAIYLVIVTNNPDSYVRWEYIYPSLHWHFLIWTIHSWPGRAILLLGLAGTLAGLIRNSTAKAIVTAQMGVQILPADDELSKRVATFANRLGIPPPEVGMVNVMNAFAVGSSRKNSLVVIGIPLAKKLGDAELDAVIGHELGHIATNDMQRMQVGEGYQILMGGIVQAISWIGVLGAQANNKRDIARLIHSLGQLGRVTIFLGGELILRSLSRKREYYADAIGASLTNPATMISALESIHEQPKELSLEEDMFKCMMFRAGFTGGLLATHPTLDRRREALQSGKFVKILEEGGNVAAFLKWVAPHARRGALIGMKHGGAAAKVAGERLAVLKQEGIAKLKTMELPKSLHEQVRVTRQSQPAPQVPRQAEVYREPNFTRPYDAGYAPHVVVEPTLPVRKPSRPRQSDGLSLPVIALMGFIALLVGMAGGLFLPRICFSASCYSPEENQVLQLVTGLAGPPYDLSYETRNGHGNLVSTHNVSFKVHGINNCAVDVSRFDDIEMAPGLETHKYGLEDGRVVFDLTKATGLTFERSNGFHAGMMNVFAMGQPKNQQPASVLNPKFTGEGVMCAVSDDGKSGHCPPSTLWETPLTDGKEEAMMAAFHEVRRRCNRFTN